MTTSARLEKIFDEAKKELEDRQKTTRQKGLREGSVAAQQKPLLQDADFYESELHDFEEALKGAEGRRKDAQKKIRSTTNNLKKAEAWLRDASARWFIPASVEAQADLAKEWNAAAREMFGLEIIDEAEVLTSGRSLDASLLEIRDGFGEEIARLEDEIVEQENVDTDASDEVATVQADIKSTQRDIETTNYELDRITEKGLTEEGVEARLGNVPDLKGLDSKGKDEAIVKWLMEGDDPELSFDEELQGLVDSDEITAGLPRVRQLMRDNEKARTRERISSGERLLRDTEGSPEAVRRAAVTDAARETEEPFSPERVRREAAQDRRERAVEREREEVPFGDPEGFGTVSREVLEEDEPFSPERMRRANVFREDADPGVGGPLEAGERDKFRGPISRRMVGAFGEEEEEEEEEETVEIVDDDDDGDTTTTTTTDADADADADAAAVDLTSDATATFILENFGLTTFFLDREEMLITDPETGEPVNVLKYIQRTGKTNDEEVLGLISQTKWYQDTGPTSRAFERDWSVAGKAGRAELLDETSDLISREAKKIGLTLTEDQLYSLSFNAKMMGMDQYEIREEFVDNWELSFDSEAVQSGNIAALRNKVNQAAGKYMLLLDDDALATAAESLYLGETSLDGLEAGFRNQAIGQMPELGNLIKQGYTPQMYFSSYKTQAERLLERKIDFLGNDRNMFINVMGGQSDDTFIQKPLTLTQANRYFRGLDEWKYTKNARQEARGMADQVGRMFGAVA
tara:strand:+ start:155 stop:2401 length:2247 start_codon:yes stop_codon:yes gene_type:complete